MSSYRTRNAAELAEFLTVRIQGNGPTYTANLVCELQKAARICHRNAERMCNGVLKECPQCQGNGSDCKACLETGYPTLAREQRMLNKLRITLKPYKLRLYEQGDPRGWPLYLVPEESGPAEEDASCYDQRGNAVCPH